MANELNIKVWDARKHYKVGERVSYDNKTWKNITGFNTQPDAATDWVIVSADTGVNTINYASIKPPQRFNPDAQAIIDGFATFVMSASFPVAFVCVNGWVLDDAEYVVLGGTSITVSPASGYNDIDDEVLVFQHSFDTSPTGASPLNWLNVWVDGTYAKNDFVRDGSYAMIANKTTTDRPSPQNSGLATYSLDKATVLSDKSNTSIVTVVHTYTLISSGYVKAIEVYAPSWDLDAVTEITYKNLTSGAQETVYNPRLNPGAWSVVATVNELMIAGTEFSIAFSFYNSQAANAIDGGWDSNQGTGAPANQDFNIDILGNIPIDVNIVKSGDSGNAYLENFKDSPSAKEFQEIVNEHFWDLLY